MTTTTRVTGEQVWEALKVIEAATVSLCESLVFKYGTQRAAAERIGVSTVHFSRMMNGYANASLELLESMCNEVDG